MSGGSMEYLYLLVRDASIRPTTLLRRALIAHMQVLARALEAVERNDSGDGADREDQLIAEVLGETRCLEHAVLEADEAMLALKLWLDVGQRSTQSLKLRAGYRNGKPFAKLIDE